MNDVTSLGDHALPAFGPSLLRVSVLRTAAAIARRRFLASTSLTAGSGVIIDDRHVRQPLLQGFSDVG